MLLILLNIDFSCFQFIQTLTFHVTSTSKHRLFTSPIYPQISTFHVTNPSLKHWLFTSPIHPPNIGFSCHQPSQISAFHIANSSPKHWLFMSLIHPPNISLSCHQLCRLWRALIRHRKTIWVLITMGHHLVDD